MPLINLTSFELQFIK